MSSPAKRDRWLVAALVLGAISCAETRTIERPDDNTLIEYRGAGNKYRYHATRLLQGQPRGPATPVLAIPPTGAQEMGLIEVKVEYGGAGPDGLYDSESDFYSSLATLAGEMGGTHFIVLRSTKETRLRQWITSLTVDVLAVSSP